MRRFDLITVIGFAFIIFVGVGFFVLIFKFDKEKDEFYEKHRINIRECELIGDAYDANRNWTHLRLIYRCGDKIHIR